MRFTSNLQCNKWLALSLSVAGCGAVSMAACSSPAVTAESTGTSSAAAAASFTPTLGPSDVLAPSSVWYKDVSKDAVAPNSASMLAATTWGDSGSIHVDFSIKVMQVGPGVPTTSVTFPSSDLYLPDSDTLPVPVPTGGSLEGETGYTCTGGGDCHLLVIDTTSKQLFELWEVNNTSADGSGSWTASDETMWMMNGLYTSDGRGAGCTSADAAGLSVIAGLIGVREANAGVINHAIRFILPNAQILKQTWVAPATHSTGATKSTAGLPYGARLRLKSSFDASQVTSKGGKAVIAALQKYGMILADAGQDAFTAEADDFYAAEGLSWNNVLGPTDLTSLKPSDFDVVDYDTSLVGTGDNCVRAPEPPTTGGSSSSSGSSSGGSTSSSSSGSSSGGSTSSSSSGSSSGGSTSSSSSGSSSGGSSSGGGIIVPPGGGPNLLPDPGFQTSVDGFEVWPSGTKPVLSTSDPITGTSSMKLVLPAGSAAEMSVNGTGTGVVHATAKLRNDGSAPATIRMCAGIYDRSWNGDDACNVVVLTPKVVTSASASYALPSGTTAVETTWYVENIGAAATVTVDDGYLGYAAK
jgi:serine/threonine-protein kinase